MPRSLPPAQRSRGVTAVLGPTNTGKTHYAIERMTAHATGMIGLPLRLLAREVYQRVVEKAGAGAVALVTGEEKIKPERPRFWISTVEAMPRDLSVEFVAIDEIQLAADLDRGHVFTDRLLNQRGRAETLLIGAGTMRPLVEQLLPGVHIGVRPRLSTLSFAGEKKITRLPPRCAIVAFSADEVYAVAELIRRQKGGAAVVLGSLSPRTRNAQVDLFQNGDVDYIIATDAIGMGLNLDVEHVAFASDRKFDGHRHRRLRPAEFGQIAGRAGRNMRDGTFGTTGRCEALEPELISAIENHQFEPLRQLQWRNPDLSFRSIGALKASLAVQPDEPGLTRAPAADDLVALEILSADESIRRLASTPDAVERLWEACQVPDYRKVSATMHAELVAALYRFLIEKGRIPADWFARQVEALNRTEGDIDTLSNRIAQIRTWTFVANRPDWLADPEHWQGVTRQVEDKLSDALHERLAARFVDRRTSVLMRRLRENAMLEAEVSATGDVLVEGQHVGTLSGFRFLPDARATGPEARALNTAAQKALVGEIEARAARLSLAGDGDFVLAQDGTLRWKGEPVAKLAEGERVLEPRLRLIADDALPPPAREQVELRLGLWLKAYLNKLLGPLLVLEAAPDLAGLARGVAYQLAEALGVLDRAKVGEDIRQLDQDSRAALRKHGVRFGAYHIYLPLLLKPAPRALATQLWALKHGGLEQGGRDEIAALTHSGRTSIPANAEIARDLYRVAGFRVAGERALRVDILERLADLIRPAIAYRPGVTMGEPPPGAADGDGFVATNAMTSLVGASGADFASILKALGYASETRKGPAIKTPLAKAAPASPVQPAAPSAEDEAAPAGETEALTAEAPAVEAEAPEVEALETNTQEAHTQEAHIQEAHVQEVEAPATATQQTAEQETVALEAAGPGLDEAALAPETPAVEGASADSAPEEAEIEVWRPQRHNRGDRQAHQRRERGRGAGGNAGQAQGQPRGEGRGPRPGGSGEERRDGQPPPRGRPQGERVAGERFAGERNGAERPGAERAGGERGGGERGGAERPAGDRQQRFGRKGGGGKPFERGDRRPEGEEAAGGRPPRGRDDRRPRPDRRDDRPQRFVSEAPRKEREPDPNSPFAKLAALKAQLEGGRKP